MNKKEQHFSLILLLAVQLLLIAFTCKPIDSYSLNLETEYRLRSLLYSNLDFDKLTFDYRQFYTHRLRLGLVAKFDPRIEIGTYIQALGLLGSTSSVNATILRETNFTPWVEQAYIKVGNIAELPLTFVLGRQRLEYGSGMILSDNGLGLDALRIILQPWKQIITEIFNIKLYEGYLENKDFDVYGLVNNFWIKNTNGEFSYFEERDETAKIYNGIPSSLIMKQFYNVRLVGKVKTFFYDLETSFQRGKIQISTQSINFDANAYIISGGVTFDNFKPGKLTLKGIISNGSGDEPTTTTTNESFQATLTKKYDGLERVGIGELFTATVDDAFLLPVGYSGVFTYGFGANFVRHTLSINSNYFIYKANHSPKGLPKDLGREIDILATYQHSKYIMAKVCYAIFIPNKATFLPTEKEASFAERILFEFVGRF